MRITILAIGSRGDIVPYIALSRGLMNVGHTVRLSTHQAFAELVRSYDIPFFALDDEPQEIFQTERGGKLLAQGSNPYRFAQQFAQQMAARTPLYMQRSQEACQDADAVVVAFISLMIGYTLTEKYKKRLVMTLLQPTLLSTTALPEPTSPWLPQKPPLLGKAMNKLSHVMAQQYTGLLFLPAINAARKSLYNLPPLPRSFYATLPGIADLVLCAYSSLLISRPADWSKNIHVTGFWTLPHQETWQPESDLVAFLQAGSAPIYIGFGSMNPYHPTETIAIVEAALTQIGQRGILLVDKDVSLSQKHSDILYLTNNVAHDWLFPQMQAIVHHGGAGTTAASLQAGVPTVIVPSISDQWFWGYQVARIGVGPRPISRKNLTTQNLVDRLNTALKNQGMRQKAREMGARIKSENGVEQGVKLMNMLGAHI